MTIDVTPQAAAQPPIHRTSMVPVPWAGHPFHPLGRGHAPPRRAHGAGAAVANGDPDRQCQRSVVALAGDRRPAGGAPDVGTEQPCRAGPVAARTRRAADARRAAPAAGAGTRAAPRAGVRSGGGGDRCGRRRQGASERHSCAADAGCGHRVEIRGVAESGRTRCELRATGARCRSAPSLVERCASPARLAHRGVAAACPPGLVAAGHEARSSRRATGFDAAGHGIGGHALTVVVATGRIPPHVYCAHIIRGTP